MPLAHWVWGGGFLQSYGVLDFAGGTVVHINAGVAGLVAALMLGKRRGYGTENLAPYDLSLAVIGTGLLWVGWFGFNGGSALSASSRASMAIVATHLAASAGALTWMALEWKDRGKPSVLGIISGAIAGLGTITPASGFVLPWHGIVIGIVAGGGCYWACTKLKLWLGYDDSLDVFGVHGVGGMIGVTLTGVFATAAISIDPATAPNGLPGLIEGNPRQVLIQIVGVLVTVAWSGVCTARHPEGRRVRHGAARHARSRADGPRHHACTASRSTPEQRPRFCPYVRRFERLTNFYACFDARLCGDPRRVLSVAPSHAMKILDQPTA